MSKLVAGIDLHSNNLVCSLMAMDGRQIWCKRFPASLPILSQALKPYRKRIDQIAVESTFNWYWLVDGLLEEGYSVKLANPAAMCQYEGLKQTNDDSDARFLAELLRLGILPTGHIYDKNLRPVRDMLRRRMGLVQMRTSIMMSLKSLHIRTLGKPLSQNEVKRFGPEEMLERFDRPADQLVSSELAVIKEGLGQSIAEIEKAVLAEGMKLQSYQRLQTIPGIGKILGLTISLETGPAERFASPGHYASYCRCVKSEKLSNGKAKGKNNEKCGNKYLAWAFIEAAHCARRYSIAAARFYERKKAKTNTMVATKALACKLAKAAWHVMHDNVDFDERRVFGGGITREEKGKKKLINK